MTIGEARASSKSARQKLTMLAKPIGIGVGTLVVLGIFGGLIGSFNEFSRSLDGYYGVKLTDSRNEVQYRLGEPSMVSNGDGKEFFNGTAEGAVPIPSDKNIEDFSRWKYMDVANAFIAIDFNGDKVSAVSCLIENDTDSCVQIAGVGSGTSEERVLAELGKPSRTRLSDGSKVFRYDDLGVSYGLVKGEVIATQVRAPPSKKSARFKRWSLLKPRG